MASYEELEAKLVEAGAKEDVAHDVIATLGQRLSPRKTERWLADPSKAHPIVDPESSERFGTPATWTPIRAVSAGKAELVLEEARRFVA